MLFKDVFDRIAKEIFAVLRPSGQPESAAKENAEKFARDYSQRGMPEFGLTFSSLLKG